MKPPGQIKKYLIYVSFFLLIFQCTVFVGLAQEEEENKDLLRVFNAKQVGVQRPVNWSGTWTFSSRFYPRDLKIKPLSAKKFRFTLSALNGANEGEISGTAEIRGNKAFFDDRKQSKKVSDPYGCQVLFVQKVKSIDIKTSAKCSSYAGNAVSFEGEVTKGKKPYVERNFVDRKVFPNLGIDRKFKLLVGKEYVNFLDDFHQIYPEDDLDGLHAQVFSACVRGICPFNAGIIMFDDKSNIWAAIMNLDNEKQTHVFYFTNNSGWTDKLPKTIEKWVDDKRSMNENLTIIFKNKR
jgi:hypothetical protein